MDVRSAPLPRMAGHLSYMRARRGTLEDLFAGAIPIVGLPFEDGRAPHPGQSLAPRALRETSVYFGWHANPQFSQPVDMRTRRPVEADGLYERLIDLGDLSGRTEPAVALHRLQSILLQRRVCTLFLGGNDQLASTAFAALPDHAFVKLGGLQVDTALCVAPVGPTGLDDLGEQDPRAISQRISAHQGAAPGLFVQLDLSVFPTALAALTDSPRLGGAGLAQVEQWLQVLGTFPTTSIMLTGLNPTRSGMGRVKTGHRLMATAMLSFLYARAKTLAAQERPSRARQAERAISQAVHG